MKTDFKVAEVQLTYKNRIPIKDRQSIHSSTEAYNLVKHHFPDETIDYRESFKAVYMNRSNHVLGCLTISEGGPCSTAVDVKLILQGALLTNASGVILAHNHPSGDCTPSRSDIELTRELKTVLKSVRIKLEDHIVISTHGYYSMKEHFPFMHQA
jgi:DNA repair protein RadC